MPTFSGSYMSMIPTANTRSNFGAQAPMTTAGKTGGFDLKDLLPFLAGGGAGLFGLMSPGPEESIEKRFKQLEKLAGPVALTNRTRQLYNLFSQSPAMSAAQADVLRGSNVLRQGLQRSLGQRGLSTSGIGAVAVPMAESAASFGLGQLKAQTWQQAMEASIQSLMSQLGMAAGADRDKQFEIFGALLGALGPLGRDFMNRGR